MSRQVITQAMANQINATASSRGILPESGSTPPPAAKQPDPYQDRLLKLIPAEVVAAYLAVFQVMKDSTPWLHYASFILLLLLNILYKRNAGVTDWIQILISSFAFGLWVIGLGGPDKEFLVYGEHSKTIAAVLVPIYTAAIPLLYK